MREGTARSCAGIVLAVACFGPANACLRAWEGHDWQRWKEVTTWSEPRIQSNQAGRKELVRLLANEEGTNAVASPQAWAARRREIAGWIGAVLGTPGDLRAPPMEVRTLGEETLPDHVRRKVLIRAEPDDWIPAFLLIPKAMPPGRMPAAVCLHQTVAQGKAEPCGIQGDPELAFALELVRRGVVCLAPDAIGFGERIPPGTQPYHDSLAFYRKHPSWSFMGKMIWDVSRAVDYLGSLPFVDRERIGCIGHSHGAYGALFAAAFEPRFSAVVASCGFTTFRCDPAPERWSHSTALIPQLGCYLPDTARIPFDWQHVLALVAPRRLYVWYATQDTIFPRTENLGAVLEDVRTVYELSGAGQALVGREFAGPHRFPREGREVAYRWLEAGWLGQGRVASGMAAGASAVPAAAAEPAGAGLPPSRVKSASAFYPAELVARARANAGEHAWAAEIRDSLEAAAKPWRAMSDEDLWNLMFANTIRRSWHVWSNGHCPACRKPVPMYEWVADALGHPWKMRCPQCREFFPKNDFLGFYRSGLNPQGVFEPGRADRALLFNAEHPDPGDPRRLFGVDDGEGWVEGTNRWRFVGAYLIFGQWKQAVVGGIRNLAAAYLATGDPVYAHKAGVLLDRVADLYPAFDFGKEGVLYEGPARSGYVSTWHDACVEALDLALAYDAVFEGLARDAGLVSFLRAAAAAHQLPNPKSSFARIQENIEERIFRDTLRNRPKIESNYPSTDVTILTLRTVLEWPGNRREVLALLDDIIARATAVDGVSGEKGLAGYSVIAPRALAELLGRYARADAGFLPETLRHHPALQAMYRFHLDTWCLGQYYPRTGDTGSFAERNPAYAALGFTKNPGVSPSSYTFLWDLYTATGDADFVRLLYQSNGSSTHGLPYDLFASAPPAFQSNVASVVAARGAAVRLTSVNKSHWGLAILRSGEGSEARAVWLDYDSGERHGHADAMNLGLFAKGLDLLPDFGYPPVQYGGWSAPRAVWYTQTAAHNTVAVDGQNTRPGTGATTLWFDGARFHAVRASGPQLVAGRRYERTVALVDVSERDFYLIDLFRVAGGKEHTRFLHGHFGPLETQGLALAPVAESRYGEVMREFRRDPRPAEGWSAEWTVEDRLKYLPDGSRVRLRHTDLTREAQVEVAESWVSVGAFGGTAEAWIPTLAVRRRSEEAPLTSTFVGVLEPYATAPALAAVRRLDLRDGEGKALADPAVGIEIRFADGARDVFISTGAEAGAAPGAPPAGKPLAVTAGGLRLEGDLCLVRLDRAGRVSRALLCRADSLFAEGLSIRTRDSSASFEIDLEHPQAPLVSGPAGGLESVEAAGVRRWPK